MLRVETFKGRQKKTRTDYYKHKPSHTTQVLHNIF